ncbi:hypothetical protein BDR07DRAFT_1403129 [Suillus spraguei]|nr:hypothetical protein BDR07DRAFT_1403129 [Suillus spraguei]
MRWVIQSIFLQSLCSPMSSTCGICDVSLGPGTMECSDLSVTLFVHWPNDCLSRKYMAGPYGVQRVNISVRRMFYPRRV